MSDSDIQIVSNEAGEPTAVIVPIELWREIASERETAYLLHETMKQRLLAAARRQNGLSLEPEPLKHELSSCWSRRINQAHRLVYQILPDKIRILSCRYHY